jgi:hypothetical protein
VHEIFSSRTDQSFAGLKKIKHANILAKRYGVTEKAIRDIWSRRTWSRQTLPRGHASIEGSVTLKGEIAQQYTAKISPFQTKLCSSQKLQVHVGMK